MKRIIYLIIFLIFIFGLGIDTSAYAGEGSVYYHSSQTYTGSPSISSLQDGSGDRYGHVSLRIDWGANKAWVVVSASAWDGESCYCVADIKVIDTSTNTVVAEKSNMKAYDKSGSSSGYSDSIEFNFKRDTIYSIQYDNVKLYSGSRTYDQDEGVKNFIFPSKQYDDSITVIEIGSQKQVFDVKLERDSYNSIGTKTLTRTRKSDGVVTTLNFDNLVINTRNSGNCVIYTILDSGLEPETTYSYSFRTIRKLNIGSGYVEVERIFNFTEMTGPPPMDVAAQEAKKARQILDGTNDPNISLANTFYNGKSSAQWAYESRTEINNLSNKINEMKAEINEIKTTVINNDVISPVISALHFQNNKTVTFNSIEKLYLIASDNQSEQLMVRVFVNGIVNQDWMPLSGNININMNNGLNNVTVEVKDESGNIASGNINIWKL